MAYIGTEGYAINFELREGKQHCQKDTPAFLTEVPRLARPATDRPLLFLGAMGMVTLVLTKACKDHGLSEAIRF